MNRVELAQALECSEATVSRICSGERRPSVDLMTRIRRVLRWTVESQVDEIRCGTYAQTFVQKMERTRSRVVGSDTSSVRGMQGAGIGDGGMSALEADEGDQSIGVDSGTGCCTGPCCSAC